MNTINIMLNVTLCHGVHGYGGIIPNQYYIVSRFFSCDSFVLTFYHHTLCGVAVLLHRTTNYTPPPGCPHDVCHTSGAAAMTTAPNTVLYLVTYTDNQLCVPVYGNC